MIDAADFVAEEHLAAARQAQIDGSGSPNEFALSLRHKGYKSISDFKKVKPGL